MSIFHAIETLKECETVLAALATTDHDEDEYLLHDRTKEQHARGDGLTANVGKVHIPGMVGTYGRVDHGGAFIAAFLGKDTGDQNRPVRVLTGLPYLVIRADKAKAQHETNNRYTRFKLGEVKDYLVQDILRVMDYYSVRERATEEVDLPAQWQAQVQAEFPQFANRKMRIDVNPRTGHLLVALLDPIRAMKRGFGTYLEDIQAGEVSISPDAAIILSTVGEQHCGGLPAFMAWPRQDGKGPTLAGMLGFKTVIQRPDLSIPPAAWADLEAVAVVE